MRPWRNRQTRTFEGRVGDRAGSSPAGRTIIQTDMFHVSFFIGFVAVIIIKLYNIHIYDSLLGERLLQRLYRGA